MKQTNLPLIMIASDIEMQNTLKKMRNLRTGVCGTTVFFFGTLAGRDIIIVKTGVGSKNAKSSVNSMLQRLMPRLVLTIGAAGAIDPHLNVGDIIVAKSIILQNGTAIPCHDIMTQQAVSILSSKGFSARVGAILAVDGFIHQTTQKAKLFGKFGASVIDMESGAIAQKIHAAEIPFLDVRIVSDTARSDTVDLETFYQRKKKSGSAAATLTMMRRPIELVRAAQFLRDLNRVGSKIAKSIELFLYHGIFDTP